MVIQLNVYEAKARFSELLNRVQDGEEVVVARAGRPVARIVPLSRRGKPRVPGSWRGQVRMSADFDELPPEVARSFTGDD